MTINKKIFITGASGGIGSAICKKFVDKNFILVLTSSSENKILELKKQYGDKHYYYKIDLSDSENVQILGELGSSVINDINWVENDFIPEVQQRGKAVIDARGASSATSAAKAAIDTVIACENPTDPGDCFSAALASDGSYDVPKGIICGYPLMTLEDGSIEIKRDISLSEFAKNKFQISIDELLSEREAVKHLMQ